MKIVFLTVHEATSPRKVDFHFWGDVFTRRGHHVDFVTVGFSPITALKSGGRHYRPPFNVWVDVGARLRKYLWRPPFHPFTLGHWVLNTMMSPLFSLYPNMMPESLLHGIVDADLFLVENGAGLMLVSKLAAKFPKAQFIYNVCDRIETLGYHPLILAAEKEALAHIDEIRVPAQVMVADYPAHPDVRYIPHGLDKSLFDAAHQNPYPDSKNVISVGDMLFDSAAIETMARAFPDWTFHLFGKKAYLKNPLPNVLSHGEKPFDFIVPYILHADIGLAPYHPAPNADYLSQSSMKMIQYTYARLPIIAPHFAAAGRHHICAYDPSNKESIVGAMNAAAKFDRATIDTSQVMDWESTADALLKGILKLRPRALPWRLAP